MNPGRDGEVAARVRLASGKYGDYSAGGVGHRGFTMMTINLADGTEKRVRDAARRRGIDATEFAVQLVEDALTNRIAGTSHSAGTAMLLRRRQEEATTVC